jgi:hypothetical protein
MCKRRKLLRAAIAIHDALKQRVVHVPAGELPVDTWSACQTLFRRAERAKQLGLQLAANRLVRQQRELVSRLRRELTDLSHSLDQLQLKSPTVTLADVLADLVALDGEFEELSIDIQDESISVTTEPIVLEGIPLGSFKIVLDWECLGVPHGDDFRVIAKEPNPAAADDSVTHPHVQDESLCTGDGRAAIRRALEEGRLFDFFVIVASLLRTYNSSSPYMSLSSWSGVECSDCGETVRDDEQYRCELCNSTICDDCSMHCSGCGDVFCASCLTVCVGCEQSCCADCLRCCAACHGRRCRECLHNNDTCEECHVETSEEAETEKVAEHDYGIEAAKHSGAAFQPDGLGEAVVPA